MAGLPTRRLGDLVTEAPHRAAVFDRLGLDFCCHGQRTLAEACDQAGVPLDSALDALRAAPEATPAPAGAGRPGSEPATVAEAAALADDIVARHHRYLREALPALVGLAEKVTGVHGQRHPELAEVGRLVVALRDDLLPHLDKEERILFPAVAAGARAFAFDTPVRALMAEHEAVGDLLVQLRGLTSGYAPPADACASYDALFSGLAHLEADTHVHIHTEQNVLFPLLLAKESIEG